MCRPTWSCGAPRPSSAARTRLTRTNRIPRSRKATPNGAALTIASTARASRYPCPARSAAARLCASHSPRRPSRRGRGAPRRPRPSSPRAVAEPPTASAPSAAPSRARIGPPPYPAEPPGRSGAPPTSPAEDPAAQQGAPPPRPLKRPGGAEALAPLSQTAAEGARSRLGPPVARCGPETGPPGACSPGSERRPAVAEAPGSSRFNNRLPPHPPARGPTPRGEPQMSLADGDRQFGRVDSTSGPCAARVRAGARAGPRLRQSDPSRTSCAAFRIHLRRGHPAPERSLPPA